MELLRVKSLLFRTFSTLGEQNILMLFYSDIVLTQQTKQIALVTSSEFLN